MKKLLLAVLVLSAFIACDKEDDLFVIPLGDNDPVEEDSTYFDKINHTNQKLYARISEDVDNNKEESPDNTNTIEEPTNTTQDNNNTNPGTLSMEEEILRLINNHRKSKGAGELKNHTVIEKEAYQHSKNMAKGTVDFGHDGFKDRVNKIKENINNVGASAENVAYGYTTAQQVINGWLSSSGHKKNIENPKYNLSGIGVAKDSKGRYYYTHIFIQKKK